MYVSRVRSSGLLRFKINFWSYESIYTFRQHFLDGELVHHKACVFTGHDNTEKRRHTYIHVSSGIRTHDPSVRVVTYRTVIINYMCVKD